MIQGTIYKFYHYITHYDTQHYDIQYYDKNTST